MKMLHHLVQKHGGKETIVFTDTLPRCKARKKALSNSQRGKRVIYLIVPADTNEKYQRPPHNPMLGGGDATTPRLTKWN